jgi:hypothetical protein
MKVAWNDLNIPARISTLAAAGLPMLLKDNSGHIVATQSQTSCFDIGILFDNFECLSKLLRDKVRMNILQNNVLKCRKYFSFDYHVSDLIIFFKEVIKNKK